MVRQIVDTEKYNIRACLQCILMRINRCLFVLLILLFAVHVHEAHLLPGWWIVTSGLQAPDPLQTLGSSSPLHMRKMCALYMIVSIPILTCWIFFKKCLKVFILLMDRYLRRLVTFVNMKNCFYLFRSFVFECLSSSITVFLAVFLSIATASTQTRLVFTLSVTHHNSLPSITRFQSSIKMRALFTPWYNFFLNLIWHCCLYSPSAWQCVLRDIRSTQNSERNDRGPQEYVEKNPNPNLHCKLCCTSVANWVLVLDLTEGLNESKHKLVNNLFLFVIAAFTPVDLSDLKKRNTQDSKKS